MSNVLRKKFNSDFFSNCKFYDTFFFLLFVIANFPTMCFILFFCIDLENI